MFSSQRIDCAFHAQEYELRKDAVDAITERDREFDAEFIQANTRRPLGLGIGRPNSLAVSIHSLMTTSTFLSAACRVGPSAAQPGNSGTSAMNASSSALQ